jgi:hypothetical protein
LLYETDRVSGSAAAYTFLSTANYVTHEGSKPMNITWRLDKPIPAKFIKKTNKLVGGKMEQKEFLHSTTKIWSSNCQLFREHYIFIRSL